MLQCVAMCCSVLDSVAVCCSVQRLFEGSLCATESCCMASLRYACCSVVEYVAVCYGVSQCVAAFKDCLEGVRTSHDAWRYRGTCVVVWCNVLQCVAVCCSHLLYTSQSHV